MIQIINQQTKITSPVDAISHLRSGSASLNRGHENMGALKSYQISAKKHDIYSCTLLQLSNKTASTDDIITINTEFNSF